MATAEQVAVPTRPPTVHPEPSLLQGCSTELPGQLRRSLEPSRVPPTPGTSPRRDLCLQTPDRGAALESQCAWTADSPPPSSSHWCLFLFIVFENSASDTLRTLCEADALPSRQGAPRGHSPAPAFREEHPLSTWGWWWQLTVPPLRACFCEKNQKEHCM